jgi:hypothetical protein
MTTACSCGPERGTAPGDQADQTSKRGAPGSRGAGAAAARLVGTGQPGDPEFDGEGRPGNAVLERRAGELRDPLHPA